ncbi:hypothetical protein S225a_16000 [Candidatus Brocadiaceae bacterium S225]|nr:hypothetical protein S225a_16000 [Candidatus Brocadiaceae bacterium S225]
MILEQHKLNYKRNILCVNLGMKSSENPTLGIVSMQGSEFTERILTPLAEEKLELLIFREKI